MRKLTITSENGSGIAISNTAPYILRYLDGIGIPGNEAETRKSPNQDGVTYIKSTFETREIVIGVGIVEQDEESLYEYRENLAKVLNPKYRLSILLEYPGNKKLITGYLVGEVVYTRDGSIGNNNAELTIECDNPFWTDETKSSARLAISVPTFHFPLAFAPKITFSKILNKQVEITNYGHVNAPVNIKFYGPSTNPIITNETTGLFIKVNKTLLSGEVLEINTYEGKKYVKIDGVNVFGYIDLTSNLSEFALIPGENIIAYDADSGASSAEVIITYNNRYVGV